MTIFHFDTVGEPFNQVVIHSAVRRPCGSSCYDRVAIFEESGSNYSLHFIP